MVTKLGFKRLLAAILVATAAAAGPARAGDWMPLLPDQDFYDFQLFAPPHLGEYSIYKRPNEGVFFEYDRLYWGITAPLVAGVGNQNFWPVRILSPTAFPDIQDPDPNDPVPSVVVTPTEVFAFGTGPSSFNLDNSWMMSKMTWGNRYEGGWVYDDYGVLLSGFMTGPQAQSLVTRNSFGASSPNVTPEELSVQFTTVVPGITPILVQNNITYVYYQYGNTPPDHQIDQEFTQTNEATVSSFEVDFFRRVRTDRRTHDTIDFSVGARFFQLQEYFNVGYRSFTTQNFPVQEEDIRIPLQRADWSTLASNNLVGPQIGMRGRSHSGRWSLGYDLKVAAEANFVNAVQRGSRLSSTAAADYFRGDVPVNGPAVQFPPGQTLNPQPGQQPPAVVNFPPVGVVVVQNYGTVDQNQATQRQNSVVFAPLGEWRLDTTFKVSKAISLRLGYSGMWLGGISRASRRTTYIQDDVVRGFRPDGTPIIDSYEQFGLANTNKNDYLFVNGVDFGFEINR